MEVVTTIQELQKKIERLRNGSVGLVHARGPLHEGHKMLIQQARLENFIVIVSHIVVPREFEDNETYKRYPKKSDDDKAIASLAGTDFFFEPEVEEFERGSTVQIELKDSLKDELKGQNRPRYYEQFITTFVKLLNITRAKRFYISDKDLQKIYFAKAVVRQLVYPCEIKVLHALRDESQLLLGAQTALLKGDERKQAARLYTILQKAKYTYRKGVRNVRKIKWQVENDISKLYLCRLMFIEILEPERLKRIEMLTDDAILMIGVRVGKAQLYDYVVLGLSSY